MEVTEVRKNAETPERPMRAWENPEFNVVKLVANQDKSTVQPEVIKPTRTFKPKASAQPFELAPGVVSSDGIETTEVEKNCATESSKNNSTAKEKVNPHFI